jgi:hypothetical protein
MPAIYEMVSNVPTDTFSLELVLYELTTGHHPFCLRFVARSTPRCHAAPATRIVRSRRQWRRAGWPLTNGDGVRRALTAWRSSDHESVGSRLETSQFLLGP